MQTLLMIALSMRRLESNALFYLAAAVSDFYVPWESMVMDQSTQDSISEFNLEKLGKTKKKKKIFLSFTMFVKQFDCVIAGSAQDSICIWAP